ncbi:RIP metalloprotease RseP, partial [Acidobacteriota bacterium]
GLMIFVHEFGHYIVSKLLGVTVEVFSLGFGPKLIARKLGDTEYRISALPLGGYVRLKGENPDDPLDGDRTEFLSRPKWQRALVYVMGPLFNLALAVVAYTFAYMGGMPTPDDSSDKVPVVEWIEEKAPAREIDVQLGDVIIKVDGKAVKTWMDVHFYSAIGGARPIELQLDRDGEAITRTVYPIVFDDPSLIDLGLRWREPAIMYGLEDGAPAQKAGFQEMDQIVKINDQEIIDMTQAITIIHGSPGKPLTITVDRNGEMITREVVAEDREGTGIVGFNIYPMIKLPFFAALNKSVETCSTQAGLIFRVLKLLFKGDVSRRSFSGPIDIAKYSRYAFRTGTLLLFIAFISLQLGIVNLLPIPVLDGGHLFILMLEGISRRDFSMKIKERIMQFGMILLVLIMVFVIVNDIEKNISGAKPPW